MTDTNESHKIPEEDYKYILENMPICCVDLVIKNNKGEVLLLKRKNLPAKDEWWLPGGRILKKETIKEAAVRIAKEEVGFDAEFEKIIGVDETIFDDGPFGIKTGTHSVNIYVSVNKKGKEEVKIDDNHSDYQYFSDIKEEFHPYVKKVIIESRK